MYISLYRKYRPQTFSDMVGQSAAVSVLQRSLKDKKLGHAYLFSGPRGCGKTSAARLVAKTLNCSNPTDDCEPCGVCANCVSIAVGEHLDVIEIDGASNRGIGEIRDLKSHVNLKPLSSPYKVYIIDEVHMLTEAAFNALLKTLEEPPANVVFMLATTEPHKVPVTIRSRCQHIPFHRISTNDMVARINYVASTEEISAEGEAVWEIARQADGALRDALSLMEQAVALGNGSMTLADVNNLMGGSSRSELEKWVSELRANPEQAAAALNDMLARGVSLERLSESFFTLFRDLWIYAAWQEKGAGALDASEEELVFLRDESKNWRPEQLKAVCAFFAKLLPRTRYGMRQEVFAGLVMIELTNILEGKITQPAAPQIQSRTAAPAAKSQAQPQVTKEFRPRETAPASAQPNMVPWDDGFDDLVAPKKEPRRHDRSVPVQAQAQTTPACTVDFKESFGDGDLSKLLSHLGPKALTFAAAFLHADLYSDEEKGWVFEFEKSPSLAESFLNIPQNRRLFAKAVKEVWAIDTPESAKAQDEAAEPSFIASLPGADDEEDAGQGNSEMGTVLKLMGAEVLYVKDKQDEDSEEQDA